MINHIKLVNAIYDEDRNLFLEKINDGYGHFHYKFISGSPIASDKNLELALERITKKFMGLSITDVKCLVNYNVGKKKKNHLHTYVFFYISKKNGGNYLIHENNRNFEKVYIEELSQDDFCEEHKNLFQSLKNII